MSQLSKTQIHKLILEAVQELKAELDPKKDKNGDPRDVRVDPLRVGRDKKLLLLDKEKAVIKADEVVLELDLED